jgi:hypothetical protein
LLQPTEARSALDHRFAKKGRSPAAPEQKEAEDTASARKLESPVNCDRASMLHQERSN